MNVRVGRAAVSKTSARVRAARGGGGVLLLACAASAAAQEASRDPFVPGLVFGVGVGGVIALPILWYASRRARAAGLERPRSWASLAFASASSILLFWIVLSLFAAHQEFARIILSNWPPALRLQVVGHVVLVALLLLFADGKVPVTRALHDVADVARPQAPPVPTHAAPAHVSEPVRPVPAAPTSKPAVFVSYRRADSGDVTGRIHDRLVAALGVERVFTDVDSIPLGVDFRAHVAAVLAGTDCMLAVIGRDWLTVADDAGRRRLDDPADLVRIEIETALERGVPVVPLLVQGAAMPVEAELPSSLRPLAYRNGMSVRPNPDFHRDMDRLEAQLLMSRQPRRPQA